MIRQENSQVANSFENYQTVGKNVPRGSRASLQRRHYLRPSFLVARINVFASFNGLMPGVRIKMLMGNDLSAARRGKREVFPCPGVLAFGFKCHFQRGAAGAMPKRLQPGEGALASTDHHTALRLCRRRPRSLFAGRRAPPSSQAVPYFYPSDLNSKKKRKKKKGNNDTSP